VIRRVARAFPTLLRVGFAEAVAYRAELLVWMLTTTMPLVMLALWTAVARDGQFGRFRSADFVAYYLAALIVRTLTSCWVVWEMNQEIRTGTLSMRLLRPVHPFLAYAAQHLAAVPLRAAIALPIAGVMLVATSGSRLPTDPVVIALIPIILAGSWLITYISQTILGSLAMMMERSVAVWEIWMGFFAVMSGYLVPLELMPRWIAVTADWLPFRYMLGFPVEVMIGMADRAQALRGVASQAGMIVALVVGSTLMWRRGLRRFEAYGA
jgi:ABC-2 type transport system permease protein